MSRDCSVINHHHDSFLLAFSKLRLKEHTFEMEKCVCVLGGGHESQIDNLMACVIVLWSLDVCV